MKVWKEKGMALIVSAVMTVSLLAGATLAGAEESTVIAVQDFEGVVNKADVIGYGDEATIMNDEAMAHSGTKSVKAPADWKRFGDQGRFFKDLALDPNTDYVLSYWVKGQIYRFGMITPDTFENDKTYAVEAVKTYNDWTEIKVPFKTGESVKLVKGVGDGKAVEAGYTIELWAQSGASLEQGGKDLYLDDFTISTVKGTDTTPEATATPGPAIGSRHNFVVNGDFSNGLLGWNKGAQNPTVITDEDSIDGAYVHCEQSTEWSGGITQGIALSPGEYTIEYYSKGHPYIFFGHNYDAFEGLGNIGINSDEWVFNSTDFTVANDDIYTLRLFAINDNSGSCDFDSIAIFNKNEDPDATPEPTSPTGLIPNGDFEKGSLEGSPKFWPNPPAGYKVIADGSVPGSDEGNQVLQFPGNGSGILFTANAPLKPDQLYKFSFKYKNAFPGLYIHEADKWGDNVYPLSNAVRTTLENGWTLYELVFNSSTDAVLNGEKTGISFDSIRIRFDDVANNPAILLDDVSLNEYALPVVTDSPTLPVTTPTPAATSTSASTPTGAVTATPTASSVVSPTATAAISNPPGPQMTNKTAYVPNGKVGIAKVSGKVTVSSKNATVYKKASTKKGKLASIKKGNKVSVKSINGIYAKVKTGKKYGYIKVENLKFYSKQTGKIIAKTYAYQKANNKAKKLKTYAKNAKLTLNSRYGKYYRVTVRVEK